MDPLHVQVIELIERRVTERRDGHRVKVGNGVKKDVYPGMVGQIRECTWFLQELAEIKQRTLDAIESDAEDEEERQRAENRANRHQSRSRRP